MQLPMAFPCLWHSSCPLLCTHSYSLQQRKTPPVCPCPCPPSQRISTVFNDYLEMVAINEQHWVSRWQGLHGRGREPGPLWWWRLHELWDNSGGTKAVAPTAEHPPTKQPGLAVWSGAGSARWQRKRCLVAVPAP